MKQGFLILLIAINQMLVCASTYYVRTDGNNSNSGTGNSSEEAWQTLNYAMNSIAGGDTLFITDGN